MTTPEFCKGEPIACKRCGQVLGNIVDNTLWLVSGLLLSEAHGVCAHCGESFHYSVTERQLKQLLDVVINRRERV